MANNPQTVTIRGRLSWPKLTMPEAIKGNEYSSYPKTADKIAPSFALVVDAAQLEKLVNHITTEFIPWAVTEFDKAGKKPGNNKLDPKDGAKLDKQFAAADWDDQPPYIPVKPLHEKTAGMAPEGVASVSVSGRPGVDIKVKARVADESQWKVPPTVEPTYPLIADVNETTFETYAGVYVAVTLNIYSYYSGKTPGVNASASTIVILRDDEQFGGGVSVDEDEIFLDD